MKSQSLLKLQQRLQDVARIGQEINQELGTVDDLFDKLRKHITDLFDASHVLLLVVRQSQSDKVDLYVQEEGHCDFQKNIQPAGLAGEVIEKREEKYIEYKSRDIESQPVQPHVFEGTRPMESLFFLPLVVREDVSLGMLSIQHPEPYAYNEEDLFILRLLANHVALALYSIRLYSSLTRLNEMGQALTQKLGSEEVLQGIVNEVLTASRADLVILYPYSSDFQLFAPPHVARNLQHSSSRPLHLEQLKDTARMMLGDEEPIFVKTSAAIDVELPGNNKQEKFFEREEVKSTAVAPLRIRGNAVGVLFINFRKEQRFDSPQKLLIKALAHYAAITTKNAEAIIRRRMNVLITLQDMNVEPSRAKDPETSLRETLEKILEQVAALVGAQEASILLPDSETHMWGIRAAIGPHAGDRGKRKVPVHESRGITGWVLKNKRPARVGNVRTDPYWKKLYLKVAENVISELDVPLLDGEEAVGVLNCESTKEDAFSEDDENDLVTLARQAVLAIKNAQAYERERREAQRFELLYQAGRELGKITELAQLKQAYDVIVNIAKKRSQCLVVIRHYDKDAGRLELSGSSDPEYTPLHDPQNLDVGVNGQVARERRTIVIDDINSPPPGVAPVQMSDREMHSLLIIPILFEQQYYGNLGLFHKDIGYFQDADIKFFEGLAQQLASTIYRLETVQARQEAEVMSSIGQVAFGLTHHLSNELGLVEFYVDSIQSELEKQAITSDFISQRLKNILQAVRKVLDLSRGLKQVLVKSGEVDKLANVPEPISPRVLLEETLALSSVPPNIQTSLEIDNDVADVQVIPRLADDILRDLVVNAIEAMPGGGKITLRAHNADPFVALEVIDTGIGIPPKNLSKIFSLFYSTKGSTGFGLWSARLNARRNHGELIVAESRLEEGTTFRLLLPRR